MAQYKLNISHNDPDKHINYNEAIEMLNDYKFHKVGQPIAVVYYDDNNKRQLMLAVGKMNYNDIEGKDHGSEFYEIINDGTNYPGGGDDDLNWEILTDSE